MKNKKLIIGLGLGVGAYLLWNLKRKKMADKQLELDKSNQKPKSVESIPETGGIKPSKTELTNEQVIALFKRANNYYRGGARPTQELIDRINKDRMEALKEVEQRGLMSGFKSWKAGEDAKNKYNLYPSAPSKGTAVLLKDKKISTRPYGKPIMLNMNRI